MDAYLYGGITYPAEFNPTPSSQNKYFEVSGCGA